MKEFFWWVLLAVCVALFAAGLYYIISHPEFGMSLDRMNMAPAKPGWTVSCREGFVIQVDYATPDRAYLRCVKS